MRLQLNAIIEELQYLKGKGINTVYLADDTLKRLKSALLPPASKTTERTTSPLHRPTSKRKPYGAAEGSSSSPALQSQIISSKKLTAEPPVVVLPEGNKKEQMDWLRERVLNCSICQTHVRPKKKIVFGVGSLDADIFFCGEAPGEDEETKGVPFIGPAGQLLTLIIEAMGLKREKVYIGNIMNWRPEVPNFISNRPPTQEEMRFCLPYLKAQLAVVKPKVVVALGATAVNGLLGYDSNRKMNKVRGVWHDFEGISLMITYHPSYILRNRSNKVKRTVWEDMMAVMEHLQIPISEKQRRYFI